MSDMLIGPLTQLLIGIISLVAAHVQAAAPASKLGPCQPETNEEFRRWAQGG